MAIESRRVKELFGAAIELSDAIARAEYLDRECGTDAELRQRLNALLQAHDASASALEQPLAGERTGDYQSRAAGFIPAVVSGTVIAGKYKLLELIGEGGMGSVWMAQQTEPVKRHVAVKLIKAGMDSKQVIARFEAERQALAVMDHPNIAKILDGGVTEKGSPYFVMELVKGVPITKYCDEHKLTPRQRLELFVPVCQAIQHAHQKGIIHRDIKPSNVMVALYDDKPIPKVIDFGVAKAMGPSLTDQSLHTGFGGIAGTPEYMSPEQASLNNLDIDTRSDIYSLGILLYELLAGSPPFKRKELEQAGLLEILRMIREEEPPRPSTKLSTADALPSLSANRGTEPKKLTGILRNELDWIVMKALEKDRTRRYETANGFAADINRYLAGEPVNAHPPSAGYRMKKFLRKNQGPVLASTAVAAALLVGIVGFAWQARIAQDQRDVAREERNRAVIAEGKAEKRADELKIAEARASKRVEELEKVSKFQAHMLGQVSPTKAGKLLSSDIRGKFEAALGKSDLPDEERRALSATFVKHWQNANATDLARDLIDRTILKPAVLAIDKQFSDQPVVDAALRQVLATLYRDLGMFKAATPLQGHALALRRKELGEDHLDTLTSINEMAVLLDYQGQSKAAEPFYREALEKRRRILGDDHKSTLNSIHNLGIVLQNQGKLSEAAPYIRESIEKSPRVLGEDDPGTIVAINSMGLQMYREGKPVEAEQYYRQALEKSRRVLGDEDQRTLVLMNSMGGVLRAQDKLAEAEPYILEASTLFRRMLGENHPDTIRSINNVGMLRMDQGNLSGAEPFLTEALSKLRRISGDEHPDTLLAILNLSSLRAAQTKHAEVIELLNPAEAAIREIANRGRQQGLVRLLVTMGKARIGLHNFTVAEANLVEANSILNHSKNPTNQECRDCSKALVDLYTAWHAAEPTRGYDAKAAEWKVKLDAMKTPSSPPAKP